MRRQARAAAIMALCAGATAAESDRLQPDFTFRRVGVPESGATSRITVQIDPNAPRRVAAAAPPLESLSGSPSPATPAPAGTDWFWNAVSPLRAESRPGRLAEALAVMANAAEGASVPVPRLQTLQEIARIHGRDILAATVGTRVSPALALAVIAVESGGRPDAVSRAGASGLMQLMPDTAARFGVGDALDAQANIRGGIAYLDWLMGHFDGDPILVLAGYNAGEGSVRDNSGVPPFAETRAYVPRVLAAWQVARGLCLTPPELVSDGCVFAVNTL
ncbi:MAG: lytic transglycosylase domain-containing protein [Rubellimicrobium sp.]|nr:lytic transglycosylase domain-containing protein [Rubellimicrobium sp.]